MNCTVTSRVYGARTLISHPDVVDDIIRLGNLWTSLRERCLIRGASQGQESDCVGGYLFGHFSIADCMFAPVVLRFKTYDPELTSLQEFPLAQAYVTTLLCNEYLLEWVDDARLEGPEWKLDQYEAYVDP